MRILGLKSSVSSVSMQKVRPSLFKLIYLHCFLAVVYELSLVVVSRACSLVALHSAFIRVASRCGAQA